MAIHAHPTNLTPQTGVMGDFLQTSVLYFKLGLRRRGGVKELGGGKAAMATYIPTPNQLTVGAYGSIPTYSTLRITDTHDRHDY